jgi:hypothetical protein
MTDDNEYMSHYTFAYRNFDENKSVEFNQSFDDCVTWPTVLNAFTDFLSSVYGYDVSSKVRIEASKYGIDQGWSGGYFDKDDADAQFVKKADRDEFYNMFDDGQDEDFAP